MEELYQGTTLQNVRREQLEQDIGETVMREINSKAKRCGLKGLIVGAVFGITCFVPAIYDSVIHPSHNLSHDITAYLYTAMSGVGFGLLFRYVGGAVARRFGAVEAKERNPNKADLIEEWA